MKAIPIILLLMCCFCSHNLSSDAQQATTKSLNVSVMYTEVGINENGVVFSVCIDSCEYIYVSSGNASWGGHKGNCKYCAARASAKDSAMLDSIKKYCSGRSTSSYSDY
jgi:hypothetical protein